MVRIARSAPRGDTEFLTTAANTPALGQQTSHAAICVVTPTASHSCWHRVSSGVCGPTPSLLLAPPQGPLQDPYSTPIPVGLLFSPLILLEQSYLFAASVTQSAPGCAPQGPSSQHHESRPAAAPLASPHQFRPCSLPGYLGHSVLVYLPLSWLSLFTLLTSDACRGSGSFCVPFPSCLTSTALMSI